MGHVFRVTHKRLVEKWPFHSTILLGFTNWQNNIRSKIEFFFAIVSMWSIWVAEVLLLWWNVAIEGDGRIVSRLLSLLNDLNDNFILVFCSAILLDYKFGESLNELKVTWKLLPLILSVKRDFKHFFYFENRKLSNMITTQVEYSKVSIKLN